MQIIITVRTGNAAMQTWDDVECAVAEAVDKAAVRFDASAEPRAGDTIGSSRKDRRKSSRSARRKGRKPRLL